MKLYSLNFYKDFLYSAFLEFTNFDKTCTSFVISTLKHDKYPVHQLMEGAKVQKCEEFCYLGFMIQRNCGIEVVGHRTKNR